MGPLRHPRHNWLVAKSDHYQVRKLFRRPSRELAFDPGFARLRSNQISRMVHLVEEVLWSAQRRHPFSRTRLATFRRKNKVLDRPPIGFRFAGSADPLFFALFQPSAA